jgi:AraC family transcriptional regulator
VVDASPDLLRDLLDTIVESLDDAADARARAERVGLSRWYFDRLVSAKIAEPPATLRRRLLLERAAWRLRGGASVTEVGFEAGYGSTEAFSRAFSAAFGMPPSRFADSDAAHRLDAPNGLHFHPPAGLRVPGNTTRSTMDLDDRLFQHDHWQTQRLLERASALSDEQLDREMRPGHVVFGFDGPEPSVRKMLDKLVWTKEVWTAAIGGRDYPDARDRSLTGLRRRYDAVGEQFLALARRIRDKGEWDDAFIDALCAPPQSFTFGGVLAHILTFAAHRRMTLVAVLRELGVKEVEDACPIEWERLRERERDA